MKTIHYAGDSVLMNDELADAVVEYAAALARMGSSAELTVPVVLQDGSVLTASLLLGPASQLIATPTPEAKEAAADPELLAAITRDTALLGSVTAEPIESPIVQGIDELGLE
jgi:hypothetical protein